MTHADLVSIAAGWLWAEGCCVVITELTTACHETPDAIGWRAAYYGCGESTAIECKASRTDFLRDRRKPHRLEAWPESERLGLRRFMLAPPGVIQPGEQPEGWGLLVAGPVDGHVSRCRVGGVVVTTVAAARKAPRAPDAEVNFLLSALRRIPQQGRGVRVRVYRFDGEREPRATLGIATQPENEQGGEHA